MEVILLESVANLGDLGDKVTVKSGFGRNFLIPQKKAVAATAENVAVFEERRAELEKAAAEKLSEAQARAKVSRFGHTRHRNWDQCGGTTRPGRSPAAQFRSCRSRSE